MGNTAHVVTASMQTRMQTLRRQYEEIIAYNEGYLAGYQTAMEYETNPF
jgi:hypothetical protein